jgi:predicted amidohydrolase YtcJ
MEHEESGTSGFTRRGFVKGAAATAALAAGTAAGMGSASASAPRDGGGRDGDGGDADLALVNGNILTLDGRNTVARSLSIKDGRIVSVSRDGGAGSARKTVDLRGATVIPGLIDSHIHFIRLGIDPGYGVRTIEAAQSIHELLQLVSDRAKTVPSGAFITCLGGWNRAGLTENRLPTPSELASAAPHNPVYLVESGGSASGITNAAAAAFFVANGVPVNADGTVSSTTAAKNALVAVQTDAERLRSTSDAVDYATSLGLTMIQDQGGLIGLGSYAYSLQLWAQDQLNLRVRFFNWSGDDPGITEMETRIANMLNRLGDERYRPVGVGERVHNSTTDPINIDAYKFAAQNGWTLTQHSLTPQEIAFHIGAYQQAATVGPIDTLRWSLCHVDPITDAEIAQVKAMGIGLNIQGYGYIRAAGSQSGPPFRSLVRSGIPLGAGTDATVVGPMDPWLMMYFMTTGNNNAGQPTLMSGQTISRLDALRMYTSGSAYLSFDDDTVGTIEPGKFADLAVLSDNPLTVSDNKFRKMSSDLTLVNGNVVNRAGAFAHVSV